MFMKYALNEVVGTQVFDDSGGVLTTIQYAAPRGASTLWVLGLRSGSPGLRIVPKIDAPQVRATSVSAASCAVVIRPSLSVWYSVD